MVAGGSGEQLVVAEREGKSAQSRDGGMFVRDELINNVISAAIEVQHALGRGLHESVYQQCMARELALRDIEFVSQPVLPVNYKGLVIDSAYRVDLIVQKKVILEIVAQPVITPDDRARLTTFMRLAQISAGLLLNFNAPVLREELVRVVL